MERSRGRRGDGEGMESGWGVDGEWMESGWRVDGEGMEREVYEENRRDGEEDIGGEGCRKGAEGDEQGGGRGEHILVRILHVHFLCYTVQNESSVLQLQRVSITSLIKEAYNNSPLYHLFAGSLFVFVG